MADRYASHLPILRRAIYGQRPRKILEYGAGLHSTPLFLRDPAVERVLSIEPDPEWRRKVAEHCSDSRLILRAEPDANPVDFDLVFIDNGQNALERLETIRSVLSRAHPPVVIHDAEEIVYAAAIKELAAMYAIYPTDPDTAMVWS